MNPLDLIFIACLNLKQGSECSARLTDCANAKKAEVLADYLKKNEKTATKDVLEKQPNADWSNWILDCAKK